MKYKVGTIAQMLDISIETVRNYEKMGLINPERDDKNDYRLYDAIDINVIRRVRSYSSFGLPVRQAVDLVQSGLVEDLAHALKGASKEIAQDIAYKTQLYLCTEQHRQRLNRIAAMRDHCCIENSPAMYGIIYRDRDELSQDKGVLNRFREWNKLRPFTEAMLTWRKAFFTCGTFEYSHGLCIEETFAEFFGIPRNDQEIYFPPRKSMYTFFAETYEPNVSPNNTRLIAIKKALAERNLSVAADPFGRVLHTGKLNGQMVHYVEMWIPIEE